MFKAFLKLVPFVDNNTLNSMEKALNGRFARVAKTFGGALKKVFIGGGIAALGGTVIAKLLNPLKDAEETLQRLLTKGDDLETNAKEFGTNSGSLGRLQALAQSKGLDAETLNTLLSKFQVAVAEAQADPEKAKTSAVRDFIGESDTAKAFFDFIQSLQAVDKNTKILAETEVFGEKQRLKAREFLGTGAEEFAEILKGLPSAEEFQKAAQKIAGLSDAADILTGRREAQDFIAKSKIPNEKLIRDVNQSAQLRLNKENQDLAALDQFKPTSIAVQELTNKFDKMALTLLTELAPRALEGLNLVQKGIDIVGGYIFEGLGYLRTIKDSKFIRGITNFFGK
jgi:hypothetical protein